VEAVRLERMRDLQLDFSYRDENSQLGTWARRARGCKPWKPSWPNRATTALHHAQRILGRLGTVADNPSDSTYRTNLLGATDNLATAFHELNTSLVDERAQVDDEIAGIADTVNGIASHCQPEPAYSRGHQSVATPPTT
jgi:flagellar hook-associated protein FlgK